MAVDGIQRVGSISPLGRTLKVGADRRGGEQYSEVDENRKKHLEEKEKEAEDFKKKQQQKQEEKEREQELDMLEKQLEASKEEAEAVEDQFEAFSKCLKIASRVAKGDIVPAKDIRYLAEHEPDLYKQSILMRIPNPKPKKHKSITGDDDERSDEPQRAESPESRDLSGYGEDMSFEESAEGGEPER